MRLFKKHYIYKLDEDYVLTHAVFTGVEFSNEFCSIKDSKLTVFAGYTWDGCTPRIHIAGLFSVGTPNGVLKEGKPWTYYASLVHDVLTQFRQHLPFTKEQVTLIFEQGLISIDWPLTSLYVHTVSRFGPQDF